MDELVKRLNRLAVELARPNEAARRARREHLKYLEQLAVRCYADALLQRVVRARGRISPALAKAIVAYLERAR